MNQGNYTEVAIVTGAANGIGRQIAKRLAADGIAVVIGDIDIDGAEKCANDINTQGGDASAVKCDLSKVSDIYAMFKFCEETYGKPDILVANAAINFVCPLTDLSEEDYYRVTDVNFKGTLFSIKAAGEHLKDGGRVVALSSSTTRYPVGGMTVYTGTKAAIKSIVEVAAQELAPRGIRVNSVMPGVTPTERMELPEEFKAMVKDATLLGRLGTPGDIAEVVAFLAGEKSGWITGQHILANGGAKF